MRKISVLGFVTSSVLVLSSVWCSWLLDIDGEYTERSTTGGDTTGIGGGDSTAATTTTTVSSGGRKFPRNFF